MSGRITTPGIPVAAVPSAVSLLEERRRAESAAASQRVLEAARRGFSRGAGRTLQVTVGRVPAKVRPIGRPSRIVL